MITSAYPLRGGAVAGGVEGVCYYLAGALAGESEVQLHVFVAMAERYGFERYSCLEKQGLTIHAVPSSARRPYLLKYALFDPKTALRRALNTRFDFIHFQNDALWAARSPIPAVLTIHGLNERDTLFRGPRGTRPIRSWINGLLYRRARQCVPNIIAISPYVRQVLRPSPRQRVWEIENPVADTFFQVVRQPVPRRVLFSGRITPLKNVHGLIEAFARVAGDRPDCELRLAGPEPDVAYAAKCRQLAESLGVGQQVKFLGPLSLEEMERELTRAWFLALCSFQENAPLVISEAMAASVPVVASRVGGVPWMVEEGATGYLVDPTVPGDITRGLRLALESPDLGKMGLHARALAERRFRAANVARKTIEAYRQILRHEGTTGQTASQPAARRSLARY